MATDLKRMTFAVTPEIEKPLNTLKREVFYNQTQSDMIRELIAAGIRSIKLEKKQEHINQIKISEELDCEIGEREEELYMSKNDYILLAIAEKLKKDNQKNSVPKFGTPERMRKYDAGNIFSKL